MSDALLKNTFNKISPAYELVADVTVGTATTQVDFSGLNFGKDDDLMLVSNIVSISGSDTGVSIFFNGNTTQTNYYTQQLFSETTVTNSGRANSNWFMSSYNNSNCMSNCLIKITNSGNIVYQSQAISRLGGSTMFLANGYGTSTFTVTSITSIKIYVSVANSIGVGSRFQLYRLKAKKVADIIVSSATTQVDITGLAIDKDSEYMLVSDVVGGASDIAPQLYVNGNNTATNYYTQTLSASSTFVTSARYNNAWISYVPATKLVSVVSNIKITNNGYFINQNSSTREYATNAIRIEKLYTTSTFTITSITSIKLDFGTSVGIGSRFTLYKMK